jgi:hypothetical protein
METNITQNHKSRNIFVVLVLFMLTFYIGGIKIKSRKEDQTTIKQNKEKLWRVQHVF